MDSKALKLNRILIYVMLGLLTILSILPFWLVFVNATRSTTEIQQGVSLIPSRFLISNWNVLTGRGFNIFQGFKNSFFISTVSTVLVLYFSALTAYALTAYEFKGKRVLFTIVLIMLMIPTQVSMVGFYKFMIKLSLTDSYIPLIIPAIASPSTVFFLRQYLATIYQPELIDAARIDGAGEIRIFHGIMMPMMKPALATMGIFTFVGSWNNFIMPLILLRDTNKYTLPMLVQLLKADIYRTEFGGIYLGVSASIIPLLIVYLLLSKYIIAGVTLGGVKE